MTLQLQLERITRLRSLHGRFLQHLSALEKSGHQKLFRYKQRWNIQNEEFLNHLADEARHAFHLKKLAEHMTDGVEMPTSRTRNYLTKLELFLLKELRRLNFDHPIGCYALLTYIVEKRAEKLYPVYEKYLVQRETDLSVKSIIEDESRHLEQMQELINSLGIPSLLLNLAFAFEEELFLEFMAQFDD